MHPTKDPPPSDAGVDLYVFERAVLSTHSGIADDFLAATLTAYYAAVTDANAVRGRFEAVRLRGRKRLAVG